MDYFSQEEVMRLFAQICLALKFTHDRMTIHRDIKPANVLMTKRGSVKITDFGIAKI